MSTKHTQGEWVVAGTHKQFVRIKDVAFICSTEDPRLPVGECQANAKLIASAPELLIALQRLTEWDRGMRGTIERRSAINQAKEAIKKATA